MRIATQMYLSLKLKMCFYLTCFSPLYQKFSFFHLLLSPCFLFSSIHHSKGPCKHSASCECPYLIYLWDCFAVLVSMGTNKHNPLGKLLEHGRLVGSFCSQPVPSGQQVSLSGVILLVLSITSQKHEYHSWRGQHSSIHPTNTN